jgi:hypothetical protein
VEIRGSEGTEEISIKETSYLFKVIKFQGNLSEVVHVDPIEQKKFQLRKLPAYFLLVIRSRVAINFIFLFFLDELG